LGPLFSQQGIDTRRAYEERGIVGELERKFPAGTAVLQLPFQGFPVSHRIGNMESYDHARAYIWSKRLKWSWPSFSERQRAWEERMRSMQGLDFVRAAAISGFGAIWIDRTAYQDNGRSLIASLLLDRVSLVEDNGRPGGSNGAKPINAAGTGQLGAGHFAILDIRRAAEYFKLTTPAAEIERQTSDLLDNLQLAWQTGFYPEELSPPAHYFHWAQDKAMLTVTNPRTTAVTGSLSFTIASLRDGVVHIVADDSQATVNATSAGQPVHMTLALKPNEARRLLFSTDIPPTTPNGDPRSLCFYVMDCTSDVQERPEHP